MPSTFYAFTDTHISVSTCIGIDPPRLAACGERAAHATSVARAAGHSSMTPRSAAPVVGVPLPMVSYGGSAMLVLLAAFGLVQSAHIHRPRGRTN